jgi:hypothetical protein
VILISPLKRAIEMAQKDGEAVAMEFITTYETQGFI